MCTCRSMSTVLRSLQHSSSGKTLVGRTHLKSKSEKDFYMGKSMDGKSNKTLIDSTSQTDYLKVVDCSENTDVSLIVEMTAESVQISAVKSALLADQPNELYWRLLAENLGRQVDELQEEQLQLAVQLGRKTEECKSLQKLADDGVYYATLLRQAMQDDSGVGDGDEAEGEDEGEAEQESSHSKD